MQAASSKLTLTAKATNAFRHALALTTVAVRSATTKASQQPKNNPSKPRSTQASNSAPKKKKNTWKHFDASKSQPNSNHALNKLSIGAFERRAQAVGIDEALAAFPTLSQHLPRKDNSSTQQIAEALAMIELQPAGSVPLEKYMLVFLRQHEKPLTEQQVWKTYTGLIVAMASRFSIEKEHIDRAVVLLLRIYLDEIMPTAAQLLKPDAFQPLKPISESMRSKLEMIVHDAERLGFNSPGVWSARIAIAASQDNDDLVKNLYQDAHDAVNTNENQDGCGLVPEAYIILAAIQARRIHAAGWTNVNLSLDRIEIAKDLDETTSRLPTQDEEIALMREFEQKLAQESAERVDPVNEDISPKRPVTKSSVWNVYRHAVSAKIDNLPKALSVWLYIFGRLGELHGVRKVISRMRSNPGWPTADLAHLALDAAAESKAKPSFVKEILAEYFQAFPRKYDRELLNGMLKHAIATGDPRSAWEMLSLYSETIPRLHPKLSVNFLSGRQIVGFDDASAKMLAFAALLDHPTDASTTYTELALPIKKRLLEGDPNLHPSTWSYILQSLSKYRCIDAHRYVLQAHRDLVDTLIPHWKENGYYGFDDAENDDAGVSAVRHLDLAAVHSLAFAHGQVQDYEGMVEFISAISRHATATESTEDDLTELAEQYVSGWVHAAKHDFRKSLIDCHN